MKWGRSLHVMACSGKLTIFIGYTTKFTTKDQYTQNILLSWITQTEFELQEMCLTFIN